jgi:hypothetical protein
MAEKARYYSLFNNIYSRQQAPSLDYSGSLEEVLKELEVVISNGEIGDPLAKLLLHPPRIIRAVVDYKIENPDNAEIHDLLQDSIRLGLSIFRRSPNELEQLQRFKERALKIDNGRLLTNGLEQKDDLATWHAGRPSNSQITVARMMDIADSKDVLFIALAHGGVAAGMDVYLRYLSYTDSSNSQFYVARYSTHKLGDIDPVLTQHEIKYLQAQAARRQIVVFDEDKATGTTCERAEEFFQTEVFPNQPVAMLVNSSWKHTDTIKLIHEILKTQKNPLDKKLLKNYYPKIQWEQEIVSSINP